MEKALLIIFSCIKFLFVNRFSIFFVALFKTFGMQNGDMLIFFLRSFKKVRFRKMQFLKDGVQIVVLSIVRESFFFSKVL